MDLKIIDSRLKIIVRPNASKNKIIGFDSGRNAYRVNIHAHPEQGKANVEVIKYFSKLLKKKVEIVTGHTSKEKVLRIT